MVMETHLIEVLIIDRYNSKVLFKKIKYNYLLPESYLQKLIINELKGSFKIVGICI